MIVVATAVLALGFFAPAILAGQVPIFRDFVNILLPFKLYSAHAFAAGRLPLWARESSFGVPFLGNHQSGVLYPPSAIIYLSPNALGIGLYLAAHFWIAGVGTDALLRRRGLPPRARLFGAFVMMLGGLMISIASGNYLSAAAWIPLSLVAAEDLVGDPRPRRFAWLVTLLTFQALAGAPESFAQSAVLIAAASWIARREQRSTWLAFALVGLAGAFALILSAPQILPTLEYVSQTERFRGLAPSMAMDQSLEPQTFLTLLSPHRLDGGIVTNIREREVPLIWSIYIGIVPLVLAMVGLATRRGRRWALVLAASLLLALGRYTPVYPFLYGCFPRLFGAFRYPQKFLITAHLSAVVLAAIGFAWAERRVERLRSPIPQLFGCTLLLTTLVDLWAVHQPAMLFFDWNSLIGSAPEALAGQGPDARIFQYEATAAGIKAWLPRFWIGGNLRTREAELWGKLSGNVPLVYGIGFTNGLDSLNFGRPPTAALHDMLASLPLAGELRLLRTLGVRFLTGEQPLDDPGLETVQPAGPNRAWIYRLTEAAPRIYLARRFHNVSSLSGAFRAMSDESFRPGEDAVLLDTPSRGDHEELATASLRITEDAPESLAVDVEAASAALLVVCDSFFPGWQAEVDSRPVPMLRANGGFGRAIEVPPGEHSVVTVYRPDSFRFGVCIALAGLVALAVVLRVIATVGSPSR